MQIPRELLNILENGNHHILRHGHWRIQDLKLGGRGSESDKEAGFVVRGGVFLPEGRGRLRLNLTSKQKNTEWRCILGGRTPLAPPWIRH